MVGDLRTDALHKALVRAPIKDDTLIFAHPRLCRHQCHDRQRLYTGDRLNFGMAAEMARSEGIPVELVLVADDVALRGVVASEQRRGIAGTVLVHKLCGAATSQGLPLEKVAAIARNAAASVSSMGVSLGACTLPSVGRPNFDLADDEVEIGLGIHGEHGVQRMKIATADHLVGLVIETMLADGKIRRGNQVALLVNGLGATPPLELSVLTRAALNRLKLEGIDVVRAWAGTFLSALDMPGFSLSVLPIDPEQLVLLDLPTTASAWPGGGVLNPAPSIVRSSISYTSPAEGDVSEAGQQLRDIFERIARALIDAEDELARLDGISGDGDLGASMRRGAEALQGLPQSYFSSLALALAEAGHRMRRAIAGSSGPFYATGLMRAARRLSGIDAPSATDIAEAFSSAVAAIMELGGAKQGDRTMVDALKPATSAFTAAVESGLPLGVALKHAAAAAEEGASETRLMFPRLGRASYLGDRAIGNPDAGAVAVTFWLKAAAP
jgi:dihydroxyacetone kinase